MPEGPTIVVFAKAIKKFEGETVTESDGYRNPYADGISGKKLLKIDTFGKYLLLEFSGFFITVHFGMFGSFLVNGTKKVNPSFTLHFGNDVVNFYVVSIKKYSGKPEDHFNEKLNPLSPAYSPEATRELLSGKAKDKIGDVLMNQDIFPGTGNVIRNEVLYMAGIHPESTVGKIPEKKIEELLKDIREFSEASIPLIEKKNWKSSATVYRKEKNGNHPVKMYISPKIKRKTFVDETVQKLYQ